MKINDIEKEVKSIKKRCKTLKRKKLEQLVKIGEAYKCSKCNEITEYDRDIITGMIRRNSGLFSEIYISGLCFGCYHKEEAEKNIGDMDERLNGAKIIDFKLLDAGYNSYKIASIIIKKGNRTLELVADGYDENYITIGDEDE